MPDTNETMLEQTFSDLAFSHLRDKSQALLDYLVGFQMLKQEDDGQRAVGVFGFEVDEDYYYAPIFFLNGEIRGLDSIYSVKSDLFMPLTDDWVNTIINRRQQGLGDADNRSRTQRGVHVPNYTRLKVIPGGGGGVNLKLAMADGTPINFAAPRAIPTIDLPNALNYAGAMAYFKTAMAASPRLYDAVTKFYAPIDFVENAPAQEKVAEEEKAVVIINSVTDESTDELTDEQRKDVVEGGVAVIDKRPEIAKSQLLSTESKRIMENPTSGGLYDVLYCDGSVHVTMIVPCSSGTNAVVAFCPDMDDKHCIIDSRKVWTLRSYNREELIKFLDKQGTKASGVKSGQSGVFVSVDGEGTAGFSISDVMTGIDGITVAKVERSYPMDESPLSCCGPDGRGDNGNPPTNAYMDLRLGGNGDHDVPAMSQRPGDPNDRVKQILINESGSACPRYLSDKLCVNDKCFYFIKLNTFSMKTIDCPGNSQYAVDNEPREDAIIASSDFGDYNTVSEAMDKIAHDMKVWKTGSDITIKCAEALYTGRDNAVISHLITGYGLGESDARFVVKQASCYAETYKLRYTPKVAAELLNFPEIEDTDLGGFMDSFHRQQVPFETSERANSVQNREFYAYNSPFGSGGTDGEDTFGVVEEASQTGQKEVFDAAALASLIKNHNPTDLVDKFLPTMTAGMDRVGRLLFLIYWHYEDFEERYGEGDLGDLIDNLKSVFEQLGEVIVFAKQRTLAGDPEHYGMGTQPVMEGDS